MSYTWCCWRGTWRPGRWSRDWGCCSRSSRSWTKILWWPLTNSCLSS